MAQKNIIENYKVGTFGDHTGIKKLIEEGGSAVHNYLYEYIGSRLSYPEIFKIKNIEGYVLARIVFNKKGKYQENMTWIKSSSKYLKVLVMRNLRAMFKNKLPFKVSFVNHKYFILDLTILYKNETHKSLNNHKSKNFIDGRHFHYFIRDTQLPMIGLRGNTQGLLKLGVNPGDILDWFKDNFTSKGKARIMFKKRQLENYKNDEAWNK